MKTGCRLLIGQSVGDIRAVPTTRSSRREGSTPNCCAISTSTGTRPATSQVLLDANTAGRRLGLPRARPDAGQPGRAAAGLLGGPDRRRGLRAALPRPRHRRGPGRRGAAQLLRRRLERRLGVLLLHGARRGLPAVPGVAARARHVVRRGRAGARGAGRAVRAERPRDPERRAGRDLVGEPGHQRGLGARRAPPVDAAALGRRAAPGRGVPRRARGPPRRRRTRCSSSPTTTPQEFRLARCPVPRDADQDHPPGSRCGPRTPPSGSSGSTPSRPTPCSASAPRPQHRLRVLPLDALDSAGLRDRPALRRRHASTQSPQRGLRRRPPSRSSTSPTSHPPVWSDVDLAHRRAHRAAPAGGPGPRPGRATSARRGPSRRPTGPPVPATLVRHRDTPLDGTAPALLYGYGAYECLRRPGVGPRAAEPARPRRGVRARPRPRRRRGRPALVARRPPRAQAEHLHRPHRRGRRAATGLVDGDPARHPRAQRRRAAPGRGVQPATRPVAGGRRRGAVRRRGHHDARRLASR